VAVLLHMGTVSLGFIMSAAVLVPSLLEISSSNEVLHNARAMSNADRTPRSSPASPRTTRWRNAESPLACFRSSAAASNKLQDGLTVKASNISRGKRAPSVPSQSPTQRFGSSPVE